jgi:DNA invertase Pin-like site-specific DNA recombinase
MLVLNRGAKMIPQRHKGSCFPYSNDTRDPIKGRRMPRTSGGRIERPDRSKAEQIKVTAKQEKIVERLNSVGEGVSAIGRTTGLSRPTIYSIIRQRADQTD